jgi:citrate synthase
VTGAIGSLRGPLHGGANEAAMAMIEHWGSAEEAEKALLALLAAKAKVMGFGHAIYRESDPRNSIIKGWAKRLSDEVGDKVLFPVSERVEAVMWREKKLFANADFYHASAYHFHGYSDPVVHAHLRMFAGQRLGGACDRATREQSHHPAERRLYRSRKPRPGCR